MDTINEYDKQQHRIYNQLDDMHLKCSTYEHEIEALTKRLAHSKQSQDTSLSQIKTLSQQLHDYKERIHKQEKEIEKFNKQMENLSRLSENLDEAPSQEVSSKSWNIEVNNLDAQITDVLGKLKEREISLKTHFTALSTDNENRLR